MEHCKPHKGAHHPTKCDVINDAKLFPTVYTCILSQIFNFIQSADFGLQNQVHKKFCSFHVFGEGVLLYFYLYIGLVNFLGFQILNFDIFGVFQNKK